MAPGGDIVVSFTTFYRTPWLSNTFGVATLAPDGRLDALLEDVDDGFLVVGITYGSMAGFTNTGGKTTFLIDANGEPQWTYQDGIRFGGSASVMALNSDGELVLAGATTNTLFTSTFPNSPCPTTAPTTTSSGARAVLAWGRACLSLGLAIGGTA